MKIAASVLAALMICGFLFWESAFESLIIPTSFESIVPPPTVVDVPKGSTLRGVANDLESLGVIKNPKLFLLYARIKGQSHGLKVGEYEVFKGMGLRVLLDTLTSGKSKLYSVTFPEGSNVFEMAQALEGTGKYSGQLFLEKVRDEKYVAQVLGENHSSLEGYLFPETYHYSKFTPLNDLVRAMTDRFKSVYEEVSQGYDGNLSRHEIVTLASVIEKETGAPHERELISSVFHNRLQKGMRLQSDPTIIYGYWVVSGEPLKNIRKKDITHSTPYNTYTVRALPVGPIANPGREALKAAMFPVQSEHLFFVSKNDGTHVFTSTYKDHQRAVRDFQLNQKAREGKSWRDLGK